MKGLPPGRPFLDSAALRQYNKRGCNNLSFETFVMHLIIFESIKQLLSKWTELQPQCPVLPTFSYACFDSAFIKHMKRMSVPITTVVFSKSEQTTLARTKGRHCSCCT